MITPSLIYPKLSPSFKYSNQYHIIFLFFSCLINLFMINFNFKFFIIIFKLNKKGKKLKSLQFPHHNLVSSIFHLLLHSSLYSDSTMSIILKNRKILNQVSTNQIEHLILCIKYLLHKKTSNLFQISIKVSST